MTEIILRKQPRQARARASCAAIREAAARILVQGGAGALNTNAVAEVAGEETAQSIQLVLEYAPSPPFQSGQPSRAPMTVLQEVRPRYVAAAGRMQAALEAAKERMG